LKKKKRGVSSNENRGGRTKICARDARIKINSKRVGTGSLKGVSNGGPLKRFRTKRRSGGGAKFRKSTDLGYGTLRCLVKSSFGKAVGGRGEILEKDQILRQKFIKKDWEDQMNLRRKV